MPDTPPPDLDTLLDHDTRIDLAARLDSALDTASDAALEDHYTTTLHHADPLTPLLSLAAEIADALHRPIPILTAEERARIHARASDLADLRTHGLRRMWPQLAHLGTHPAVVGGSAATVLAVVGIAALRDRRGHTARPLLGAA